MEFGQIFASIFLFIVVGMAILGDKRDVIEDKIWLSLFLGLGFFILTIACDLTELIHAGYVCAILWPFGTLYILERFEENPYIQHLENMQRRLAEDLTLNNEEVAAGREGLPDEFVYKLTIRLEFLEEIKKVYELI